MKCYQTAWHHIPEDDHYYSLWHENIKSCWCLCCDTKFVSKYSKHSHVGFEVLMAVTVKIAVLKNVMLCTVVRVDRHFREAFCLHYQGIWEMWQVPLQHQYTSSTLDGITLQATAIFLYSHIMLMWWQIIVTIFLIIRNHLFFVIYVNVFLHWEKHVEFGCHTLYNK